LRNGDPRNGDPIVVSGERPTIDAGGEVKVDGISAGRLKTVDFTEPFSVRKVGHGLFEKTAPYIPEGKAEGVEVKQGFIELSNVMAVKEMTRMIEVIRSYETYQKILQSFDEVEARASNDVGMVA
jgi:flagellar basal body rod protein FlgG